MAGVIADDDAAANTTIRSSIASSTEALIHSVKDTNGTRSRKIRNVAVS
jgi:hypothetical protein